MRCALRMILPCLLLAFPRGARAWPSWGVSGGVATVSGVASEGSWQSWSPMVTTDVTFRGGWSEVFAGAAANALVGPTNDGAVTPLSALAAEVGVGVGVPLFSVGVYGGWGWPGGTVGLYSRVTLPSDVAWAERIGLEGRLLATTADAATGGALLLRVEPAPYRRVEHAEGPPLVRPAEPAAPAVSPPPAPPPEPSAPPPDAPPSEDAAPPEQAPAPEHHDDPYGG